jgi:hypothetical protein
MMLIAVPTLSPTGKWDRVLRFDSPDHRVRAELEKNWHAREVISGLRHPAKQNACYERKPNGIPERSRTVIRHEGEHRFRDKAEQF